MEIERGKCGLNNFVRTVQSNKGFSMVELIVVTAIIGALASTALISVTEYIDKAKVARAATEIRDLEKSVIDFNLEKGGFPTAAQVADSVTYPELATLRDLKDPWGNNYVYAAAGTRTYVTPINSDFDLYSKGANGNSDPSTTTTNSLDDIIRADNGSFIGTALFFSL